MSSVAGVWVFIGLIFLGIGIGMLFNRPDAGTLIGIGAGFLGGGV